ncbi:MAG TPA: hypothetical protein VH107_00385 [Lacipirellulaceae bacterium]|jgi:hypothetical protein|nr:hypothetical protein [Lacipirellulaceae bacterium]
MQVPKPLRPLTIVCEYVLGFVILLCTLVTITIGLFISLFELPKYFRLTKK